MPNIILKRISSLTVSFVLIIIIGCRGSIDIFNEDNIPSTHTIKDLKVEKIIDNFLFENVDFKAWSQRKDKLLFLSIKKTNEGLYKARGITSVRKNFVLHYIRNNYSGYFMYKGVLVIFWGDSAKFLEKKSKLKKIFDKKILEKEKEKKGKGEYYEYYGTEFKIVNDTLLVSGNMHYLKIDNLY